MKLATTPVRLEAAPGDQVAFEVSITNDGSEPLAPTLTITGVDPELIGLPESLVIIEPGATSVDVVEVRVRDDAPAGEQRLGVQVTDPSGLHRAVTVTIPMHVGDRPPVSIEAVPAQVRGRRSALLMTVLHNRGREPLTLHLGAEAENLDVRFLEDEVHLAPDEEVEVPTELAAVDRTTFRELRLGALLQVRAGGAPRSAAATLHQRPAVPPLLLKLVAAVGVLALWAVGVVALYNFMSDDDPELAKLMVPLAADEVGRVPGLGADLIAYGGPTSVTGTVEGPADPAGTTVVIERIAFGDEGTTSGEGGVRLAAMTTTSRSMGVVIDRIDTVTDERGEFRFVDGLRAPGFYRVTASRPGFEVASQVVTLTAEEPDAELALSLVSAAGGMSGLVTDQNGSPLGGAEITITDGDLVFSATSSTEGNVGTWSVSGIATPQTYQVIATQRGYATATAIVALDGGENASGVNLQLEGGLGTIRGKVSYRGQGVGGVHVELEGNPTSRQTTTLTDGGLAGNFEFPALKHGTYRLTFSAPGWLTQTAEVVVDRGDVEVAITDLRPATASIGGVVTQEVAPGGGCRYPDPEVPGERAGAVLAPCGGIGVTVAGENGTWRTTSATGDGSFQLSGIEPGEYLVTFERFGYRPQFFDVTVEAGDVRTLPSGAGGGPYDRDGSLILDRTVQMRLTDAHDQRPGEVHGLLSDAINPTQPFAPPAGTTISVVGQPDAVVEYLEGGDFREAAGEFPEGAFRIVNLEPGAHTLRIWAPGYDTLRQVIRVASGEVSDIGIVPITRLGTLSMRVTGGPNDAVPGADVFVVPDPEIYNDASPVAFPDQQLGPGVEVCQRSFTPNDLNLEASDVAEWFDDFSGGPNDPRVFEGLCATTNATGDVQFRRTFSTGNYLVVTPANAIDVGDPNGDHFDPALAAGTVPLDHVRMVRRVEIQSGSTVPLDPNLQRYPSITGVVRTPVGEDLDGGLQVVGEFDVAFELIDDGTELPERPVFRVSGGEEADERHLEGGRYRIDRIPPDVAGQAYNWRMVISSEEFGSYTRDRGQPVGHEEITGLTFNVMRTINALLLPDPEELVYDLYWVDASGQEQEVPSAYLRTSGTNRFDPLEGPPYFDRQTTICPGDGCLDPAGDPAFDFTSADADEVVSGVPELGLTGLWFSTTGVDPDHQLTIPPFYRPGEMRVTIHALGFDSLDPDEGHDDAIFRLRVTEACVQGDDGRWYLGDDPDDVDEADLVSDDDVLETCQPFTRRQQLEVQERTIEDRVLLRPPGDHFAALEGLPVFWDEDAAEFVALDDDEDIYDGLKVELLLDDEVVACAAGDDRTDDTGCSGLSSAGDFTFPDLIPGAYDLRIRGPHVDDRTTPIFLAPGAADTSAGVDVEARTVDRRGVIRVDVRGAIANDAWEPPPPPTLEDPDPQPDPDEPGLLHDEPLAGVTVKLERRVGSAAWEADPVTPVLTTCETGDDSTGGPDCDAGIVTFTDLALYEDDASTGSRSPVEYRIRIDGADPDQDPADDYVDVVIEFVPPLHEDPYRRVEETLERYGELQGRALGLLGHPAFHPPVAVQDVEVELRRRDLAAPGGPTTVATTTSDDLGRFVFGPDPQIVPADGLEWYELRFTHPDYETSTVLLAPSAFDLDSFTFVSETLSVQRPDVDGLVRGPDGEQMFLGGAGPFSGLQVQVDMTPIDDQGQPPPDGSPYPGETDTTVDAGTGDGAGYVAFSEQFPGRYRVVYEAVAGAWDPIVPIQDTVDDPSFGPTARGYEVYGTLERRVTIDPGDHQRLPDVVLPFDQDTISGFAMGVPFYGAQDAVTLGGATVTIFDPDDPDSDDTTFTFDTGPDGRFAFNDVPSRVYHLRIEADGFEAYNHGAVLSSPEFASNLGERELIALPSDVTVTASSDDPTIGLLSGVPITPVYRGPEDEGPDPAPEVADTDEDGIATFTLPPGCWSFEAGSDVEDVAFEPRPHSAGSIEPDEDCETPIDSCDDGAPYPLDCYDLNVPFGGTFEADLTLLPFLAVSGTVIAEDDAGDRQPPPHPGDGLDILLRHGASGAEVPGAVAVHDPELDGEVDGDEVLGWRVWFPRLPSEFVDGFDPADDEDLHLNFELDGFVADPVALPETAFSRPSGLDHTVEDLVELFSETRTLTLSVATAVTGDGSLEGRELDGVTLRIYEGQNVTSGAPHRIVTLQNGQTTFTVEDLARNDWYTVTAQDAPTEALVPHMAHQDTFRVPVRTEDRLDDPILRWGGEVRGVVDGRDFADGDVFLLAGATVSVVAGNDPGSTTQPRVEAVTADAQDPDRAEGSWQVGVRTTGQGRVTFSKAGYAWAGAVVPYGPFPTGSGNASNPFVGGVAVVDEDLDGGPIVLTATPREVSFDVRSSDGDLGDDVLDGVSVTLVWDGSGDGPGDAGPVQVDDGEVSFAQVVPGRWLVTTSGASDLGVVEHPHGDLVVGDGVVVDVDPGDGPFVRDDAVTLDPYVRVTGEVSGRLFAPDGPSVLPGEVSVSVSGVAGAVVVSGTVVPDGDDPGRYTVWVPDEDAFEGLGAGDGVVFTADGFETFVLPEDHGDDVTFDDGVATADVVLTATPREVSFDVRSSDGDLGDDVLDGVSVTLVWDGSGDGPGDAGPVQVDDGAVTFTGVAPGDWLVTTSGGPNNIPPHADLRESDDTTIEVQIDASAEAAYPAVSLRSLQDFVPVVGAVSGRYYEPASGEATPLVLPGSVTVATDITDAWVETLTVVPDGDDPGTYRVWVPDEADVGDDDEITFEAEAFQTFPLRGEDLGAGDNDVVLTASLQTLVVVVIDGDGNAVDGADVVATAEVVEGAWEPPGTDGHADETDGQGEAQLVLEPGGSWEITAEDDDGDGRCAGSTVTVVLGGIEDEDGDPLEDALALELDANACDDGPDSESGSSTDGDGSGSTIQGFSQPVEDTPSVVGTVVEVHGDTRVMIPGVEVRFTSGDETVVATSTEPDERGHNLHADVPAGTWSVTAVHDGGSIPVHDALVVTGDTSTVVDVVLPTQAVDLRGQVVDADGAPVAGAQVTARSTVGGEAVLTDEDGRYTLTELDNRVTWAVTFAPPDGVPGSTVTRYLALSGDLTVELHLDQQIPAALGTIALEIHGGEPGTPIDIELSERAPFPTLNPEGRLDRSVTLDGDGAAIVEFDDLVPGDGRSLPQDRFSLVIDAVGYHPVTRANLDVAPGVTTTVTVDLGTVTVLSRQVELTVLDDAGDAVADRTVRLTDETRVLTGTVTPGSNVYRYASVEPGSWDVVVDGFEPGRITVPPGDEGTVQRTVTLVRIPEDDPEDGPAEDAEVTPVPEHGGDDTPPPPEEERDPATEDAANPAEGREPPTGDTNETPEDSSGSGEADDTGSDRTAPTEEVEEPGSTEETGDG